MQITYIDTHYNSDLIAEIMTEGWNTCAAYKSGMCFVPTPKALQPGYIFVRKPAIVFDLADIDHIWNLSLYDDSGRAVATATADDRLN